MKYDKIPDIQKLLSRDEINLIPIQECGEILVNIPITKKILHRDGEGKKWLIAKLRKTTNQMLILASEHLPTDYKIMVMSAYIPIWMQQEVWDRKMVKTKLQNPGVTDQIELEILNRKYAAYPKFGAPHNTGGSVDVIILDEKNNPLDMGSPFGGVGKPNHTRYRELTHEQINNRQMLYWVMINAGFLNSNPFEWWHYSYGDRAWAAYKGEQFAIYNGIEE
jgi:D-alanyl-D-alanine dipeptidase